MEPVTDNGEIRNISVEEFCKMNEKFGGVVRLVYCSSKEKFVICSVADQAYALFLLKVNDSFEKEGYLGLFISKYFAYKLCRNESKIRNLTRLDKDFYAKFSFRLDEKKLDVYEKYQEEADRNGPAQEIDFAIEKKMMAVAREHYQARQTRVEKVVKKKSKLIAIILSVFLGFLGADRFYLGYKGIGFLKLFTFGCWGVLWIVDLLSIALGILEPASGKEYAVREKSKTEDESDQK